MEHGYFHGVLLSVYRRAASIMGGTGVSQMFPINLLDQVFRSWMRSESAVVDGHLVHLDPRDSLNLSICGSHEPFESRILKRLVKPGTVVADIGANIGFYTLLFARAVGPHGTVHAFEPAPSNMAILERNVAANGYENVVLNRAAVTDVCGVVPLYLAGDNAVDHRLCNPTGEREAVKVPAVRLDDYFSQKESSVDLVKMDVQGAEGFVIKTLEPLVAQNSNLILVTEFWPRGLTLHGSAPEAVLQSLIDLGFELQELDERREEVRAVDTSELLKRVTPDNQRHTNLLCRLATRSS
jgi:FkbM family methyltransferase